MSNITLILLSGKRYSGKTFIGNFIKNKLHKYNVKLLNPSDFFKQDFCEKYKLNYQKILYDRLYKESHRVEMINYYNKIKNKYSLDYYCKKIINYITNTTEYNIYIIDIRHKFEIMFYEKHNFKIIKIRRDVDDKIRNIRGWIYDKLIDDDITETDLDNYNDWDIVLKNDIDNDIIDNIYKLF